MKNLLLPDFGVTISSESTANYQTVGTISKEHNYCLSSKFDRSRNRLIRSSKNFENQEVIFFLIPLVD